MSDEAQEMSALEAAFHDWADANDGEPTGFDAYAAGWTARDAEIEALTEKVERRELYWQTRTTSLETERNNLVQTLSSCTYERGAFRRQRDLVWEQLEQLKRETGRG